MRTDALPEARVQRVARSLLGCPGVRRVGYRGAEGAGGVLVKPLAPAAGAARGLERPVAA